MANLNLDDVFFYLLRNEPFYGVFLQPLVVRSSTEVPLAGVNIKGGKINLYINPHSWGALSIREQAGVLMHELDHISLNHLGRFSKKAVSAPLAADASEEDKLVHNVIQNMQQAQLHKRANWACDLAINEYIPDLPREFSLYDKQGNFLQKASPLFVESLKKEYPGMEHRMHADYYLQFLKDNKGQGSGGEQGEACNHDIWDAGDDIDPDTVRELCKQALNKAVEQTPGRVPSHIEQAWVKLNKPTNNWRNILRNFCARAKASETEDTRKRRNRRYGTLLPGYRTKEHLKIVVGIDSSGSIGPELVSQFMAEIEAVHKTGADITLVVCDAEIQSVEAYSPKKDIKVNGGGGTLYQPIMDKAKEIGCDALIVFGDGYCADRPEKPGMPTLWAISEGGQAPVEWGLKLKVA